MTSSNLGRLSKLYLRSVWGTEDRDEWHIVGLLGQIPVTKGQPTGSNWTKMKDVSNTVEMYFVK